ncbi:hypothetical protein L6452_20319 [Arctium lappa]|uniref:Uncharacterized protein n=1 Tax=Arctium lappa TaxID=4217 RepID=A0ACB9BB17_ARCLA|nr:hypothetical protein L6452_20319 [Arctium lappa]
MSSEPASSIQSQDGLDDLRRLAQIPVEVDINSPSQLMPQFWRVVLIIERLTAEWGSPFDLNDLHIAYTMKINGFHRYSLHSNYQGDRTLVLNNAVNDRWWKSRYAFVRMASLGPNSDWLEPYWDTLSADVDEGVTIVEPSEVEVEEVEEEKEEEEEEGEMAGGSPAKTSATTDRRKAQLELDRKGKEKRKAAATAGSGGNASSISSPEKANMGDPIPAVLINMAPPMMESLEEPGVERPPPEGVQATEASMTSSIGRGYFLIWGNTIFRPLRNVSKGCRSMMLGPTSLDIHSW